MSDIYTDENNGRSFGQNRGADGLKGEAQAAREKIGEAAQTVRQEAAHFAETAREKATEKVESGKETITTAVGEFADAIRQAGDNLAGKDQGLAAGLARQAADGLQALSRAVSEQRPEEMLNTVRRFGRDNPTAFLAGAVLAGLALGRFVRSSATHEGAGGAVKTGLAAEPSSEAGLEPVTSVASTKGGGEDLGDVQEGDLYAGAALATEGGLVDEPEGLGVLGEEDVSDPQPSFRGAQ